MPVFYVLCLKLKGVTKWLHLHHPTPFLFQMMKSFEVTKGKAEKHSIICFRIERVHCFPQHNMDVVFKPYTVNVTFKPQTKCSGETNYLFCRRHKWDQLLNREVKDTGWEWWPNSRDARSMLEFVWISTRQAHLCQPCVKDEKEELGCNLSLTSKDVTRYIILQNVNIIKLPTFDFDTETKNWAFSTLW